MSHLAIIQPLYDAAAKGEHLDGRVGELVNKHAHDPKTFELHFGEGSKLPWSGKHAGLDAVGKALETANKHREIQKTKVNYVNEIPGNRVVANITVTVRARANNQVAERTVMHEWTFDGTSHKVLALKIFQDTGHAAAQLP